jgi:hypothetical protein
MSLFGGMPFPVQFFLAFVIVLGLIGATAWAVRRFGAGALGGTGLRGRQPRLAVLEHTMVEGRRRLYLVRRDNVEHLLLIGGPTDIVVEPNIVRAVAAPRDAGVARAPAAVEALPRAIPLPDNAGHGSWPLQPEPAVPSVPRPARSEPPEEPAWPLQPHAEAPARTQRDTLAALADELTPRPAAPRSRPQTNGRAHAVEPPRPAPVQYSAPDSGEDMDENLAEMAHRLEAALRSKPSGKPEPRETRAPSALPRAAIPAEHTAAAEPAPPPPPPRAARAPEPKPARSEIKSNPGKALYDSLEQEMASLLGRPTGKQH